MTDHNSHEDAINHQAEQQHLIAQVSNTIKLIVDVILSRVSLGVTEAKVAIVSLALVLVVVLSAMIVLCATWALIAFALGHWLMVAFELSLGMALISVIGVNLLFLVVLGLYARSLLADVTLKNTLDRTLSDTPEPTAAAHGIAPQGGDGAV